MVDNYQFTAREDPDSSKNEFFGETYTTGSLSGNGWLGDGARASAELRPTKKGACTAPVALGTRCDTDIVM